MGMEKFAIQIQTPGWGVRYIHAGDSQPQVVAPYYGAEQAEEARVQFQALVGRTSPKGTTFTVVPYPRGTERLVWG